MIFEPEPGMSLSQVYKEIQKFNTFVMFKFNGIKLNSTMSLEKMNDELQYRRDFEKIKKMMKGMFDQYSYGFNEEEYKLTISVNFHNRIVISNFSILEEGYNISVINNSTDEITMRLVSMSITDLKIWLLLTLNHYKS